MFVGAAEAAVAARRRADRVLRENILIAWWLMIEEMVVKLLKIVGVVM